jgi:hypothetical protein
MECNIKHIPGTQPQYEWSQSLGTICNSTCSMYWIPSYIGARCCDLAILRNMSIWWIFLCGVLIWTSQISAKKQHLNHHNSLHKALRNKVRWWDYRGPWLLSSSLKVNCSVLWMWSYSLLNPSLFLLIYGLTMGTCSVPNPARFPPLVLI